MVSHLTRLSHFLLILATLSGGVLTIFVALSAIMRYAIGEPFGFTEELVGLLFSALVFLALPYVTLYRRHICITLITDLFPRKVRRVADALGDLLVVLFAAWFGYYAYDFAAFSYSLGSRTDLADILLWPWMSLMVVAMVLMIIVSLVLAVRSTALEESPDALNSMDEY